MKIFITLATLVIAMNSFACECEKYPVGHRDVITDVVSKDLGLKVKIDFRNDVKALKAYPTLVEKLDIFGFRGTSCEVTGPQGEFLYHCINKVKYDYSVKVNNCEFKVQAKSNYKKAKAKILSKECF